MTLFWIVVAFLLAAALLLLVPTLLRPKVAASAANAGGANVAVYRDQLHEVERDLAADLITPERFEQARAEIQRRVLEDTTAAAALAAPVRPARSTALVLMLVIPLASVLTYLAIGTPPTGGAGQPMAQGQGEAGAHQIQTLVTALAERLKTDPGNADGWAMLGRSYAALERYRDAVAAYQKASALRPDNADVLADLADVLAVEQGRRLAGEPQRLIDRALAIDPRHAKALALAGSAAFEAKDYRAARAYWQRLADQLPPDSELLASIRGGIAEAVQLEGGSAVAAAPRAAAGPRAAPAPAPAAAAAPAATLSGQVVLSPALAASVAPGDTLFVFARAAQGPRAPLAIVRRQASELPYRFTLDDSMAMSPDLRISAFGQVVVVARITKSGQAAARSGDLFGQSAPVAPGASNLRIVIDQVQD